MLPSCIARLTIPESHRPKFLALLSSLPDPAFKIKKKSVRFKSTSTASSTSSPETKTQRRKELGGSVTSMTPEKSLARKSTGTFRALYGNPSGTSVGIGGNSSSNNGGYRGYGPDVVDKDPEEKMAELMELKQMKIRQEDLFHIKDQIHQVAQSLEGKESILGEVRAERKSLCAELSRYIIMVKQIQKDIGLVTKAETELTKDRDELQQQLTQLKDHDFKILKEEVDDLRAKKGLQPLPTLEQEHAQIMGQYLEQRRGQWREDGQFLNDSTSFASPPPSSSLPGRSSTSTSSAAATTSSSRASTSSTGRSRQSTSTLASAPGPTSLPASSSSSRGRESSLRHGKSRQSSPGRFKGGSNNNHICKTESQQEQEPESSIKV
ncbi:Zinc finger C4H2 domain-containing protein [Mortierella polycephala]|uniref:Zinc finger C4H2 domain-containing protein n=1 Tax=Mortierella polycephala TaxID=41804 RepID=A0A9P6TZM7_9FUNG|nr:Zinc finger C4H2 domain-containing protein [Mortierella polycephala]